MVFFLGGGKEDVCFGVFLGFFSWLLFYLVFLSLFFFKVNPFQTELKIHLL